METKTSPSTLPNQSVQQPLGQPVIFKSDSPKQTSLSLPGASIKTVLAGFVMLFLVGGVGVGVYLVGQNQQLRSKASTDLPPNLSNVVSNDVINQTATSSSQASSSADSTASSSANPLSEIVVPDASSSAEASASGELVKYDFNSDGIANSVDLSVMYGGWGTPQNDLQAKADLNQDGIINGIDYSLFIVHFNQPQ